ncbi:MAG: hypothetical protein IJO62_01125 [Clostridia bacterium]|nr:hypothetical protein [Clostridia bacterium]
MSEFLTYKGLPLVRKGNEIYYGDPSMPQIVKFEVLSTKKTDAGDLPEKVKVILMSSDLELPENKRIKKETTKDSFFEALDVGFVWLERANKK